MSRGRLHEISAVQTLTHSASLALNQEVSLAFRSASRLPCSLPAAAVVKQAVQTSPMKKILTWTITLLFLSILILPALSFPN